MSIQDFPLAWRWTQASHALLPRDVIESLVTLKSEVAARTYRRGEELFRAQSACKLRYVAEEPTATRRWLRSLPFLAESRVHVAWSPTLGVSMPWQSFVTYWDDFCYPSSDDLFVFPEIGTCALAWSHDEVLEFVENAV